MGHAHRRAKAYPARMRDAAPRGRDGGCAALPHGMHPPFSFRLAEKKTRRARCKRKGADPQCTLRAQCGDAGLRTTLYGLAQCKRLARVWPDLALVSRPRRGIANFGCKTDLACSSFRCRCPYRPGSAERSGERGKRSRGLPMTTPTNCVPPTAGTASPKSYHVRREPVGGHPRTGSTGSEDPRCAKLTPFRGQLCKEKRFSFGPCTARFLWRNQRKWGVHSRAAKRHIPRPAPWGGNPSSPPDEGNPRPRAVRGTLPPGGELTRLFPSARRPGHIPPGQHMEMQVQHTLPRLLPDVGHHPVALQPHLPG